MKLAQYNKKRDFKQTSEPAGKKGGNRMNFVVQRHHASRLHYDFRLQMNGVLKSWAVPKGPSLNPKDKRLAVQVEDHPVSYKDFEGQIPEGNYGAGRVDIWDEGSYEPVDEDGKRITGKAFSEAFENGSMKFRLSGHILKGEFALVHMNENNWLLIKHKDEYAVTKKYDSEKDAAKEALAYSEERAKKKSPVKPTIKQQELKPQPARYKKHIHPMLAKLRADAFSDSDWLYEIKWDGYRAIAEVHGNNIKLYSRNGISFHNDYPAVYSELQKFEHPVIVDGEIVALDKDGIAQFQLLQQYGKDNSIRLCYYVFDVLSIDGKSVKQLPLVERKELLRSVLPESEIIKYCDHIETEGEHFFEALHEQGVEGMIAKKKDSSYIEGKRGNTWYKIKHALTDEAVIAGYTTPRGGRKYFGALVLGVYEKGKLQYIGHTGTGFTDIVLKELYGKMQPLVQDKNPFGRKIPVNAAVTWLKPELVANIKYTEITQSGIRRHPVFLGLRIDKAPGEVTGEVPLKDKTMDKTKTVGGHSVELTNLDKIYWPGEGITKGDVVAYYDSMYRYIMKYLKGRPQSLKRNPNGIRDKGFFHKDAGDNSPEWVDTYPVWSDSADKEVNYLVCNNKASLLYLANLGCIELNPWSSVTSKPDHPDYVVIDLDPSDNNSFDDVVDAALAVRDILKKAGAAAYCKTSGATGLHVYIPLGRKYHYDQARHFAELIANMTVAILPGITTVERSLKKRDKGKIYVDYLQNKRGQTLCAAYSLRPREGAPVSTPLDWKEVKHGLNPIDFNINNIKKRVEKKGDLFAPVLQKGIDMMKVLKKLEG